LRGSAVNAKGLALFPRLVEDERLAISRA